MSSIPALRDIDFESDIGKTIRQLQTLAQRRSAAPMERQSAMLALDIWTGGDASSVAPGGPTINLLDIAATGDMELCRVVADFVITPYWP